MANDLEQFYRLFQLHSWYPLVALAITIVIKFAKDRSDWVQAVWLKIPDGYRFLVPAALGFFTAFVASFEAGKPWSEAVIAAFLAGVGGGMGLGVSAMGWNAALTESPIPWNGGPGGKTPQG